MNTNVIAIAIVAMIAAAPAKAEEERSAAWFADHPKERSEVSEICKNYASQAKHNPNCDNAFQGGLIASARERDRNAGISNLRRSVGRIPGAIPRTPNSVPSGRGSAR